jgi:hypothetical protein
MHWPISRKVAAGPVVIIGLLILIFFNGWSIAFQHHKLMRQNYQEQVAYEETVLRLPHILALIQKDLFKLTIWSQIGVQGAEIRSTEESISAALHTISDLVDSLDDEHSSEALETNIRRYGNAVAQALILIKRSPAVGATATRGM